MTTVTTSSKQSSSLSSMLPGIMALFAFIACNGTIIFVTFFSVLGITLTINPNIQAATISLFACLTDVFVFIEFKKHNKKAPLILAIASTLVVIFTMYIAYNQVIESIGLIALIASAVWSWRVNKTQHSCA